MFHTKVKRVPSSGIQQPDGVFSTQQVEEHGCPDNEFEGCIGNMGFPI